MYEALPILSNNRLHNSGAHFVKSVSLALYLVALHFCRPGGYARPGFPQLSVPIMDRIRHNIEAALSSTCWLETT